MTDSTNRTPKPIKPRHIKVLRGALGVKTSDLLGMFGWSSGQWTSTTKADNKKPLSARLCMLTRLLHSRPDLSPIPESPTGREVYEQLKKINPSLTERQFPILLGLEPGMKERILNPEYELSRIVESQLIMIDKGLKQCKTQVERQDFLEMLFDNCEAEALSRGLDPDVVWRKGLWNANNNSKD